MSYEWLGGIHRPWIGLDDAAGIEQQRSAGPRNGLPESKPYIWRAGDAAREAEVEARLAALRARFTVDPPA